MKIHQTSKKVSDNRWKWVITLDASNDKLNTIEKVTYHLHPTFKKPVVEKKNRSENFKIEASGWGTFVVRIEIQYKDNHVEELRHRLAFSHDKPKVFLSQSSTQTEDALLKSIKKEADQLGWDVATADDISPGEDWESAINQQIDESQLVVFIAGETQSRLSMDVFETAKQLGKKALVMDSNDLYGIKDHQKVTNDDDLLNAFKAYDIELKGL